MNRCLSLTVLCLLAFAPSRAMAVELLDGKLSINGFGNWSYGISKGPNGFDFASPKGVYDQGEFALSIFSTLTDRIVVGAQLREAPDEGIPNLEWAFGEYRVNDAVHLRIGKVKHALGLSGDVQRVGTLRPFFTLPLSVYGSTELVADGVMGVSALGTAFEANGWSLRYDAYLGAFASTAAEPFQLLRNPTAGAKVETASELSKDAGGIRLALSTPVDGLTVMVSGYAVLSPPDTETGVRWVVGPSVQYLSDAWSVRAEYFFHRDFNLAQSHGGYLEVARKLGDHLQLGVRGEMFTMTLLGYPSTSSLLYHRDLAALVAWWFSPGFAVKAEGHFTDGNYFSHPEALGDALLAGQLTPQTLSLVIGLHFSF